MNDTLIFALPGFLGRPTDWDFLVKPIYPTKIFPLDIFSILPLAPLWEWAHAFNKKIEHETKLTSSRRILMGYSLGGRLALHVLLQNSSLWDAAIIISAHPGLKNQNEKKQRLVSDGLWAERFEKDPWDLLMHDWNNQAVFNQSHFAFERQEKDCSRNALATALRQWSLGTQETLQSKIEGLDIPLLWITGADDIFYTSLSNQMMLKHPLSKVINIAQAGHRVPWEQPTIFYDQINQFVKR